MKSLYTLIFVLLAGFCFAADPTWNPAAAAKEAEQDIRSGHIRFIGRAALGVGPVGVPMELVKSIEGLMPELAVSPTTYHFANDRKNMPVGITQRFTLTSLRSIRSYF